MNITIDDTAKPLWVTTQEQLKEVALKAEKAPWIAIDTESNSMFAYRERVCLIQLNIEGELFLVDPLALAEVPEPGKPSHGMDALKAVLEDPSKVKFIHGGEYDVQTLSRDFDICLKGIFDSQQAAQFLGWEHTGYGALVERICGVKLAKEYAQHDWGKRPVDPMAVDYAVDDVRFLPAVCDHMREAIAQAGLEEELSLALESVESMRWHAGFFPEGVWKVKESSKLSFAQMKTLFGLYFLRDEIARKANRPAGQVLNDRLLVCLAARKPETVQALKAAGLRQALIAIHGGRIIQVLKNPDLATGGIPLPERPVHTYPDDAEKKRESKLREWRQKEAGRRGVPLQVVLPSAAINWLKVHGAGDLSAVPQLGPKRIGLYGEKLKAICGNAS